MLERVRRAAPEVVRRKGHTEYAIGLCVQRICEAVLRNEHAVLAVSTVLDGEYGLTDVCLGTPCVVGKNGIERIIELDLDEEECKALHRSAETLRRLNPRLSAGAA
jgi:L-lactate dehydrogenase